jgi:hypothetical protein
MMCLREMPAGSIYITLPHKSDVDGKFEDIKLCPECGYVMKHADTTTFKLGNFTEQNIPNKLRKIRNEYRKDPIGAWDELVKSEENNTNGN